MLEKILIPRLGVNDDTVVIGEWLAKDGEYVKAGQSIVVYETTKETVEGKATTDGYLHILVQEDSEEEVGTEIAYISNDGTKVEGMKEEVSASVDNRKYTEKAKQLIEKYSIDVSKLPTDKIIREKDVEALIEKPFQIRETHTNELFIYGAGGFSRIVIDLLKQTCAYKLKGIVDMKYPDIEGFLGIDIIGNDEYLDKLYSDGITKVINAVGVPAREKVYEKLKEKGFELPNLIHKTAIIEPTVSMGEGNLILAGAMIGTEAIIGNDCVINAGAIVNHECVISDNCHIASGAILAGCVTVGENTLIGQGCTVYQRVHIGKNVIIQNGCHVFKDVPDGTVIKA